MTLTLQINDYGFEVQSPEIIDVTKTMLRSVFNPKNLLEDILTAINSTELAKRRFRDIARISGLVFEGYPGRSKNTRQLQTSTGLIFDVLVNHDSGNLLLDQSRREVLEQQLEFSRLTEVLNSIAKRQWHHCFPKQLTPLSFPLWAESLNSQTMTSMSFSDRLNSMLERLEEAAVETLSEHTDSATTK